MQIMTGDFNDIIILKEIVKGKAEKGTKPRSKRMNMHDTG